MTKIEEVARAICMADDSHDVSLWREFLPEARAAIEAMREPSEAMADDGGVASLIVDATAVTVWHAMVQAALNEQVAERATEEQVTRSVGP